MPTRKSSKKSSKRSLSRKSFSSGKILPPLDVRSSSSLKELKKRIQKGPVTIMLVYADWCGHCHEIMPHWDKAVKTPNRSIQAIKVNETMLPRVNETVNHSINRSAKPIDVEGYPTILLVDNKGNKVSDVNPVKDANVLSNAMVNVGPIAESAFSETNKNLPLVPSMESVKGNTNVPNQAQTMPLDSGKSLESGKPLEPMEPMEESRVSLYAENPSIIKNEKMLTPHNKLRGGSSLYSSMAQSAYTLAPAATLLGMASYLMSQRRGKRSTRRKIQKKRGKSRRGYRRH